MGDWTQIPNWGQMEELVIENAINPIQQYAYNNRKNATDIGYDIDAMDILYSIRLVDFCIVSSDS